MKQIARLILVATIVFVLRQLLGVAQDAPKDPKQNLQPQINGMTCKGKNDQGYEEYVHDQTGMVFVQMPAGTFKMGTNDGEGDEKPVHEVTLDSFLISKYEVTQEVWQKIMSSNPSNFKGNQNPVEKVNWNDCQDFCRKTSLRLPTEAEWEYACKAGTTTKYYWGDKEDGDYMWYYLNSDNTTHPVGQKKPNGYGLYDVSGNVWEWCQDWYGDKYYQKSPESNPKGPDKGQYRVVRGGSWGYVHLISYLHMTNRVNIAPKSKYGDLGFRCVRDLK